MIIDSAYVKETASQLGADLCGIAAADRFSEAPEGFHPRDIFPDCQSVVVFASRFAGSTLNAKSTIPYTFVRNMMVNRMDYIAFELSNILDEAGIAAVPIPSSEPYEYWDPVRRHGRGILSLKHAAVLAGLGKMGKNTLLINDKLGNMLWLSAVLLAEKLEADPLAEYEACIPGCRVCLEACPQKALDGVTIDQQKCRSRMSSSSEGGGWYLLCNICRKICPNHLGIK